MYPISDPARRSRWTARIAAMCAVALCAGCTSTVSGTAEPARDSAGIIGIGRSVPQILPTAKELASALRSAVAEDGFPPSVGGPDVLVSGREVSDIDGAGCLSVTDPFLKARYQNSSVRAAAIQRWDGLESNHWVDAGVIALASPHDAEALFAQFVGQWQGCQGKSVTLRTAKTGTPEYREDITDVHDVNGLLTAVVTLTSFYDSVAFPSERALGVAYNCIIDLNVTDFDFHHGDPATAQRAEAIFDVMAAKAGDSRR